MPTKHKQSCSVFLENKKTFDYFFNVYPLVGSSQKYFWDFTRAQWKYSISPIFDSSIKVKTKKLSSKRHQKTA